MAAHLVAIAPPATGSRVAFERWARTHLSRVAAALWDTLTDKAEQISKLPGNGPRMWGHLHARMRAGASTDRMRSKTRV